MCALLERGDPDARQALQWILRVASAMQGGHDATNDELAHVFAELVADEELTPGRVRWVMYLASAIACRHARDSAQDPVEGLRTMELELERALAV